MAKSNLTCTTLTRIQARKSVAKFLDLIDADPDWGIEEVEFCLPFGWWFACETDEDFDECESRLQLALCVGDDDEPEISKALIDAFVEMVRPCPEPDERRRFLHS